jgi:hypothetical protein
MMAARRLRAVRCLASRTQAHAAIAALIQNSSPFVLLCRCDPLGPTAAPGEERAQNAGSGPEGRPTPWAEEYGHTRESVPPRP